MADLPADLSPFRSLVSFSSESHFAIVVLGGDMRGEPHYQWFRSWLEFLDPALGNLGSSYDWEYPTTEFDKTRNYAWWHSDGQNKEGFGYDTHFINLALIRAVFGLQSVEFNAVMKPM